MSNTTTAPGQAPGMNSNQSDPGGSGNDQHNAADPLLRRGAFIDPSSNNISSSGGEIPIKSNGDNKQVAPQGAPPSSSANGVNGESPFRGRRKPVETLSSSADTASWLPSGWIVEDRVRTSGATAGTRDKYYIDPTSGRRFRSKKEVQYFLETGNLRQKKRVTEDSEGDIKSSERPGSQKNKKSATKAQLNFDYSNVPDMTEWVLTDPKEDTWTPFVGGKKVLKLEKQSWEAAFTSLAAKSSINRMF